VVNVRALKAGEDRAATRVLATAFIDSPLWEATGPRSRAHRAVALRVFFAAELRVARRRNGWILGGFDGDRLVGVMVAFPRGEEPVPLSVWPPRIIPAIVSGPVASARALRISLALEEQQPRDAHVHCWLMGAEPDTRGVGALLLRTVIDRADGLGRPVYLEAASPERAELFALFGFEPTGTHVLRTGKAMVLMWRPLGGRARRAARRKPNREQAGEAAAV
jgi:hypothetical protein